MHWMSRKGRALAGGVLLAVAAAPAFAAPQDVKPAPRLSAPAAAPAVPTTGSTQETARRISAAEARQALATGKAVLVDVRSKDAYDARHAQGALSVPLSDLGSRAGELPKNKLVITYCT